METRMRSALLVLVGLAVSGCSSPLDPALIQGTWQQDQGGIPGGFFEMTLSSNGSNISGTGHGCGEAGPCANSNIVGNTDSKGIHLTITSLSTVPTPGQVSVSRFDGLVYPGGFMIGKLEFIGSGDEIGLADKVRFFKNAGVFTIDAQLRSN
jgi:hypothetical protein